MQETNKRIDIISLGVLNVDFVMEAGDKKIGEKILGKRMTMHAGGHGTSLSIASSRNGVESAAIGMIGKDSFGYEIISTLEKEQVNRSLIQENKQESTGLATITIRNGMDNLYIDFPGANFNLRAEDIMLFKNQISQVKIIQIHLHTAIMKPAIQLIKLANELHIPIAIIPATNDIKEFPTFTVDYLILTKTNSRSLCKFPVDNIRDARLASTMLIRNVNKAIIFQLDEKGVYLATKDKMTLLDACPKAIIVDKSGMIDFFCGVFTAELIKGTKLDEAVTKAHKASMLCGKMVGVYEAFPSKETLISL